VNGSSFPTVAVVRETCFSRLFVATNTSGEDTRHDDFEMLIKYAVSRVERDNVQHDQH